MGRGGSKGGSRNGSVVVGTETVGTVESIWGVELGVDEGASGVPTVGTVVPTFGPVDFAPLPPGTAAATAADRPPSKAIEPATNQRVALETRRNPRSRSLARRDPTPDLPSLRAESSCRPQKPDGANQEEGKKGVNGDEFSSSDQLRCGRTAVRGISTPTTRSVLPRCCCPLEDRDDGHQDRGNRVGPPPSEG